jgi:predicted DNA-binding transcriptional regulator YafY
MPRVALRDDVVVAGRKKPKSKYTRIHRLLRILTLIQSQRGWTAKALAIECGTVVRTIYRDMLELEGAGVPYHFDEETGGYRVRKDFFLPPVELTLDESLALLVLAGRIGAGDQVPFTRPASKAVSKVRAALPAKIRDYVDEADRHIDIHLARAASADGVQDVYEDMCWAMVNGVVLKCVYESQSEHKRPAAERGAAFEFSPYKLLFSQRAWYALGLHGGRGEVRSLRLGRFTKIERTDTRYKIPADFSVQEHLGLAWRLIRGAVRFDVELRFDASFADTIADTRWHPTQETHEQPDGSLIYRCTVDGLDEIVWWVLSMGPHCQVIKPAELATRVSELAAEVVSLYPGKSPLKTPGKRR